MLLTSIVSIRAVDVVCCRSSTDDLLQKAACAASLALAVKREAIVEDFLVSGCMLRDLGCAEEPVRLVSYPVIHLDEVLRVVAAQKWRIL